MDNYGNTPLHWAAQKNQVESVKFLLSKGANPNLRNISMMAPLHLAVQGMHNEVVKVSATVAGPPCLGRAANLSCQGLLVVTVMMRIRSYLYQIVFI